MIGLQCIELKKCRCLHFWRPERKKNKKRVFFRLVLRLEKFTIHTVRTIHTWAPIQHKEKAGLLSSGPARCLVPFKTKAYRTSLRFKDKIFCSDL